MIFFSADHHFYHSNIIRYCARPFCSVEEMNDEMIARWNSTVSPNDVVYYLGDFSLAIRPVELFARKLHGEKHLIMGNHDLCHPIHKKRAERLLPKYFEFGFKSIELSRDMEIEGQNVLLHHMPYAFDAAEEEGRPTPKHRAYRPTKEDRWLLHGHIHEKWKVNGRMINVGVDVWDFKPVSIEEIAKIINEAA